MGKLVNVKTASSDMKQIGKLLTSNCDRKFPNRGAGRVGEPLGSALIKERAISPSSGFLQIENRTIFGLDIAKNVQKPSRLGSKKGGGIYCNTRSPFKLTA